MLSHTPSHLHRHTHSQTHLLSMITGLPTLGSHWHGAVVPSWVLGASPAVLGVQGTNPESLWAISLTLDCNFLYENSVMFYTWYSLLLFFLISNWSGNFAPHLGYRDLPLRNADKHCPGWAGHSLHWINGWVISSLCYCKTDISAPQKYVSAHFSRGWIP